MEKTIEGYLDHVSAGDTCIITLTDKRGKTFTCHLSDQLSDIKAASLLGKYVKALIEDNLIVKIEEEKP